MDYYSAKDIQRITGCKQTYSYDLIKKLKKKFKQEYPDVITIQGKIPKWYFEEKMKNKKENAIVSKIEEGIVECEKSSIRKG